MLRPGGTAALTVWAGGRQSGMELLGRACEAAAVSPHHLPRLAPGEDFGRTAEGFAALLAEAGLTDVRCAKMGWALPYTALLGSGRRA
ncbi:MULTISPECIES: hypothetical protein [Streptomyces]|uniref:Methyltransferase n=1 Tax=Streptomyces sviceus (strain ATCC 29083 / DSM 924 / JCM 4929 / NBRC 13980 / NCIMB 11184 / NRRL 5439 / UC 5370) TaxID=463191 RepID=B5HX85_STRX2|nr:MULTISPECIES: hypothetical protein [Streptomyces]EDY57439.1 conserved hypothetical protein [Streptomyces sviceus ATCC 29083]MYT06270.1 hypothetical protein [Streptomyces sp. SID5470]